MSRKIATCCSLFSVLISMILCHSAYGASSHFEGTFLDENVLLVKGPSGNTLVGVENDGLVLIEGVPAQYAEEYLAFVYQETGKDNVLALFNSHWHPQSTGLNSILSEQGVSIIAHENTKQWLASTIRLRGDEILHTPTPDSELPNETIYSDGRLAFLDSSINYAYLLQSHTDGDIYVSFTDENILYTGGTVRSDGWVVMDIATGGFLGGMLDAYQVLLDNTDDNTKIVPASGSVLSKAELQQQLDMYKGLMTAMVDLLHKSQSAEEVVAANPALGLRPDWGSPDQFLEQGFKSFYGHLRNGRHIGVMP